MPPVDRTEAAIDALINAQPVLESTAEADLADTARMRLIQDIASGIYPYDELAERYGLGTQTRLLDYLRANPAVVKRIKALKAINDSDGSIQDRLRLKAAHVLEEALPSISAMITNPAMPAERRLEAYKACQKQAGVDSAPASAAAATGTQFNLVMQFAGAAPQTISATVVEATAIADTPPAPDEDDESLDEDV